MELLEEMLKAYVKNTANKPYAIFCNKKTFKILEREMREHELVTHTPNYSECKKFPLDMYYNGIPVFIDKLCPDDKVHIIDEETYLKIGTPSLGFEKEKKMSEKICWDCKSFNKARDLNPWMGYCTHAISEIEVSLIKPACGSFKAKCEPKQAMGDKFKPGDVVRLKSDLDGHYLMTVDHQAGPVIPDDGLVYYHCVWFNTAGNFMPGVFLEEVLEIAEKPE